MLTSAEASAAVRHDPELVFEIMDKMDGFSRWDYDDICSFICRGLEETNVTLQQMSHFSKMTTYRFFDMLEENGHIDVV